MLRDKLHIVDTHFAHAKSSSWYNEPKNFDWVRDLNSNHIFMTDNSVYLVDKLNNQYKYAWLIESPEITRNSYEYIKNNFEKFDLIFTFDKELLSLSSKFILLPIGGCWIESENRKIFTKTKNLSIIASSKNITEGHKLRHEIINKISNIDVFGYKNPINNKITGLGEYRFSIVVENIKKDYYFTEKIIDCFITGTIPIYWGCPSIGNFFDIRGIIQFDNIEDLNNKIINLNEDFYLSKLDIVKNNFNEAKKFIVGEDKIYEIIKK